MPARPAAIWLDRPRLTELLSSQSAVVVLRGPSGSGKSALLTQWAATRDDVHWAEPGRIPDARDGVLVVDDADRLPHDAWTELAELRTRRPRLRLRLAVRSARDVPSSWHAEITSDLFFTAEEVGQYLGMHSCLADPVLVTMITEGLPSAVRAVARSGASTTAQIVGSLAQAHREGLPEGSELLAVPGHLTEDLVRRLGGEVTFLDTAERAGWGRWAGDVSAPVFCLTAPVRAATRARRAVTPEQKAEARAVAAQTLLDHGASLAAMTEALRAERFDLVDAALKQGGIPLLWRHGTELRRHLAVVPAAQLRRHPVIAMAQALALNARRHGRLRAVELMGTAIVAARAGPRHSPDRALMRTVESVGSRLAGLGDGGVRAARAAVQMMVEMSAEERRSLGALEPDLYMHCGVSLYYGGHEEEARTEFERVLAASPRPGIEIQGFGGLAMLEALRGALPEARSWIERAEARSWPQEVLDEYPGSMLRIAQAKLAIEDLDLVAAQRYVHAIWPIIDTIEHWSLLAYLQALIDLGNGRAAEGLERFRALRESRTSRLGTLPGIARHLDVTESLLALGSGEMMAARRLTARSRSPVTLQLAVARVALVDGRVTEALERLGRTRPVGIEDRAIRLSLEAVVLHRLGHHAEAGDRVRRFLAVHHATGLRSPLMLLPAADVEIFGEVARDVPRALAEVAPVPQLSPREEVILAELVDTASVEEIAARLHVSANTVKSQRRSLYRKLGVSSRQDALATALAHGLLD